MINERHVQKYFLYALGEIALVVIGILIALQINNWQESKKANHLKSGYLEKLITDLKKDTTDLSHWIRINNWYADEGFYLLSFLENKSFVLDSLRLKRSLALTQTGTPFPLNSSTYKDLVSSGNMRLIVDHRFKEMMDNYYSNSSGTLPIREANRRVLWEYYAHELEKYYDPLLYRQMMKDSKPWQYTGNPDLSGYFIDWNGMKQSEQLIRYLKVVITHREMIDINYKTDLDRATEILSYIELNRNSI